ncbi:thioredoxin family protein [Methylobacterium sp. sgz302541]|uniref:thioredoxin family protein n=1 Tax=unclassified Methylobacterium TaxID=2615210 RepID=UPI003D3340A8
MNRRLLILLGAATALHAAVPALAGETAPYSDAAFAAAQAAGKPILVKVSAPWCPICKAQKPILEKLAADPRFKELVILDIDFDSRKDVLKRFDARSQSTLIAYKGDKEVGRSVGETQPEWIEGLVEKTL